MVPSSAAIVIVVAVALPTRLPRKVTPAPGIADFLTTISGNIGVRLFSGVALTATRTRGYDCRLDLIRTAASFTTQEVARRIEMPPSSVRTKLSEGGSASAPRRTAAR